ncbi:MAG: helix-turn-helix domain-containing protein [Muribaculaceae bacterium]
MDLHTITINQIAQRKLRHALCYRDSLLVISRIEDIERYMSPCRIDAVTVLLCIGGKLECSVNLKHYTVQSNSVIIVFPGDIISVCGADSLEMYAILISTELLAELQIDFKLRSEIFFDVEQNAVCMMPENEIKMLKPYYELIASNINGENKECAEIMRGLVMAFCYTIISVMYKYKQYAEDKENNFSRNKILFNKFMELIKQNRSRIRGVRFYADKLCLTPNYLSGAIKAYTGKSALEWVNECVILEAKILLKNSEMNVQDIAYELEFTSQSAFGKFFKLRTGVSPKKYRDGK